MINKLWTHRIAILTALAGMLAGYGVGSGSSPPPAPAPAPPVTEEDTGVTEEDEVPSVPLLTPPLEGTYNAPQWFDHQWGPGEPGQQLVYLGRYLPGKSSHVAYDWAAPAGTPVLAAAAGVVQHARDTGPVQCGGSLGTVEHALQVRLVHTDTPDGRIYGTTYAHLSAITVTEGATVGQGELIGRVGDTGCATGPHLHFNVQVIDDPKKFLGYSVDPYGWVGTEPDPWPQYNQWLWKKAPVLQRGGRVVP